MVRWRSIFCFCFCNGDASPTPAQDSPDPFPTFPPPDPRKLLRHREAYASRIRNRQYAAPAGEMEDRPLYALYRIYEHVLLDNNIGMRNEFELFWWARWPVADIPDPGEQVDRESHAVLSCIPSLLVESFNQRVDMGLRRGEPHSIMSQEEQLQWAATPKTYESVPKWTETVLPLEEMLHIHHSMPDEAQLQNLDDPRASQPFKDRNVLLWHPHIHFV